MDAWTNGGADEFLHHLTGAAEDDEGDAVTFRAKRRGGERPRRCGGGSWPSGRGRSRVFVIFFLFFSLKFLLFPFSLVPHASSMWLGECCRTATGTKQQT